MPIPRIIWLSLLLGVTAALYWPGLHSGFLLDDHANLRGLADLPTHPSWRDLAGFAASDVSGPLGRPIPMLSFGLQHGAWPDSPFDFKLINLLLHLLTGSLVYALTRTLAGCCAWPASRAAAAAWLAAALWLMAHLQVSTVLYTVQRMTQLAALFALLSVLGWVHGRLRLAHGKPHGSTWLIAGTWLPLGFGLLCKETAAVTPLLIFALEATVLSRLPRPPRWIVWQGLLLGLPVMAAMAWLALHHASWLAGYQMRDFTLAERLLTEPRVLLDYVRQLLLPTPGQLGLFHDDYPISRGLLEPPVTGIALLTWLILPLACWKMRQCQPFLALAGLWFLGGHLLEASVLPLELYFEHRNYLPSAGVFMGLALLLGQLWQRVSGRDVRITMGGLLLVTLGLYGLVTWAEASQWNRPFRQAIAWHQAHPNSQRANERLAVAWQRMGDTPRAASIYAEMAAAGQAPAYLSWLQLACQDAGVSPPDHTIVVHALRQTRYTPGAVSALGELVQAQEKTPCRVVDRAQVEALFSALLQNPAFARQREPLYLLLGSWRTIEGQFAPARAALENAYRRKPTPETALFMARLALMEHRPDLAARWRAQAEARQHAATLPDAFATELAAFDRQFTVRP